MRSPSTNCAEPPYSAAHVVAVLLTRVRRPSVGLVSEGLLVEPGRPWAWEGFFSADPRSWILDSAEPAATWSLLTGVLDHSDDDGEVVAAHQRVLADPLTRDLIDRLPDWEGGQPLSGHDSPKFAPNLLNLLADMGLRTGDSRRVDGVLQQMLAHQDTVGHFQSYAPPRGSDAPMWGRCCATRTPWSRSLSVMGTAGTRACSQASPG